MNKEIKSNIGVSPIDSTDRKRTLMLEGLIELDELYRKIEKEKEEQNKHENQSMYNELCSRYYELSSNITAMIILCSEEEEIQIWMNIQFRFQPGWEKADLAERVESINELRQLLIKNTGKKHPQREIDWKKIIKQARRIDK